MNKIKKVLAVFLAALMAVSCLWSAFTVQAADALFTDNFTSGALSGWSGKVGTVSDGAYVLQGTQTDGATSAGAVADVAITADVAINRANDSNGKFYNIGTTTILFNATENLASRYEFGLSISKTGITYAGVYRITGNSSETLYRISTNVPGTADGKLVEGTSYALRVVTEGSSFICFINDRLFFEHTVEDLTQGYAGVSTWNTKGTFDNFKVQKAGKRELQSIRLENTPAEITRAGAFDLDIIAVFNSPYGERPVDAEDKDIRITGLDGKIGKKTLTVSYGGKSTTFTTNVVPSNEGQVLYTDTFDSAENWTLGTTKLGPLDVQAKIAGGKLRMDMPSYPGFDTSFVVSNTLKNAANILNGECYSIEVDATIYTNSTSVTNRPGKADILYNSVDGTDNRVRVAANGWAYAIEGGTIKVSKSCKVSLGQTVRMRLDVRGKSIQLFVDGKSVLSHSHTGTTIAPKLQLRCVDGTVSYDNLKISSLEEKSKWAIKTMTLVDANGQKITSHTGYSFVPSDYTLQLLYVDGTTGSVALTEDLISGYDASSRNTQNVQINYGNHSAPLKITFTDYLYYNDFSNGLNGMTPSPEQSPYYVNTVRAGQLITSFTIPEQAMSVNQVFVVPGATRTFTNYSVSADVTLVSGNSQRGIHGGIQFRRGSGTSYTYRLTYKNTTMTLYLYHNLGSGNVALKSWTAGQLKATFPLDAERAVIDLGETYNLRVDAIGNALYCFFNGVLLDIVYDTDEKFNLQPGAVDLVAINASAAFDNIYVAPIESRSISSMEFSGTNVKDGVLQVYQGFEIEPDQVNLIVNHNDGLVLTEPLWADFISQNYDPNVLGVQEMTVTYMDHSAKIKVNVVDRPDYVASVAAKIKAIKKGSLTAADLPAAKEMIRAVGTLSPYELKSIGESLYKDFVDISTEVDYLENEELKGLDQIYYNDFTEPEDMNNWEMVTDCGDTFSRNGYLTTEMQRYGLASSELMYQSSTYGQIASVEVDVMMIFPATFAALCVYGVDGTYYHLRITNKYVDQDQNKVYTLQLYKYSNAAQVLKLSTYPIIKDVVVKEYEWINLRMTLNEGIIGCYVNDVLLAQYDDSNSVDYLTEGYVCFRSSENDVRYDNFKAYGVKKEVPKPDYIKQITPTEYKDDFEDETVGKDPSHWVEVNTENNWKVAEKGGSKVYSTTVRSKPVYSWLHAFESDPTYKAKFLTTAQSSGKVGFITRMYDETAYLAVGYNVAQKKWFLAGTMGVDMETQTVYADTSTELAAGTWHEIEITLQDTTLRVLVDGQEVLTEQHLTCFGFGRMGVFADGADFYVDDVYVKSPNGTNFDDGVVEFTVQDEVYAVTMPTQDLGNGKIIGYNGGYMYLSEDSGRTFKKLEDDHPLNSAKGDGYASYLKLGENRFLKVMNNYADGVAMTVYESTDGMKTWTRKGDILNDSVERVDALTGTQLPLQHTNSLTKITMSNGVTRLFMPIAFRNVSVTGGVLGHYARIFYSDDLGATWTESEQCTKDVIPNYNDSTTTTWAEAKIIACADGSIRFYQTRNVTGSVAYMESKDYGKTWTEFGKIPYMQCPMGSFGIAEDPENIGTYYMAFVHNTPYQLGNAFPRTRLTLAKTTDGKNWEYVTEVERSTGWTSFNSSGNNEVRQFLDPGVCVNEDYIYVTFGRSNRVEKGEWHNNQRPRLVRFEKDKLTTRPWDDSTVVDTCYPQSIAIKTLPQTKYGYGDLFSTIGMEIDVTAVNGRVTTEGPKTYFLVDGEPNMFKLGKQTVRLMSKYYMFIEYDIEIVPNYDLIWTIKGKGTVDPDPDAFNRMMEGANQTFKLKPAKGYKVSYVNVNGQKAKISKNTFTISDVHEEQEITVSFVKKTIVDYLPWIILGAVVVAGIGIGCILLIPKLKKKSAAKKAEEEDIDISSSSTPPTDEN